MKFIKANYELKCESDVFTAQLDFKDNFKQLSRLGGMDGRSFFYTNYGQKESPSYVSDCYDFSNTTRKQYRAFCISCHTGAENSIKEAINDMRHTADDWESYCIKLLDESTVARCTRTTFPEIEGAPLKYVCDAVQGYSQGDFAYILLEKEDVQPEDGDYFHKLFYEQPTCIYLSLDGDEIEEVRHTFEGTYLKEKGAILSHFDANYEGEYKEEIFELLKEDLPDYIT